MVWSGKCHKSLFQVDLSGELGSSTTQAHELQQEVLDLQQSAEKQKCKQMEEIIQNVDEEIQDLRAEKENLLQVCVIWVWTGFNLYTLMSIQASSSFL